MVNNKLYTELNNRQDESGSQSYFTLSRTNSIIAKQQYPPQRRESCSSSGTGTSKRLIYLNIPKAMSFTAKVRSRMFVKPKVKHLEKTQEAKDHKETIKSLLDEFVIQQDKLKQKTENLGMSPTVGPGNDTDTPDISGPAGAFPSPTYPIASIDGRASEVDIHRRYSNFNGTQPSSPRCATPGAVAAAAAAAVVARAADDQATAAAELKRRKHERKLEQFITLISTALQLYGCPTHVLQYHMQQVASGLGLSKAQFAVFPTYTLVSFNRDEYDGLGGQTLFFQSKPGMDMYRLQLVDEIARRVASYASFEPPLGTTTDPAKAIEATVSPDMGTTIVIKERDEKEPHIATQGIMSSSLLVKDEDAEKKEMAADAGALQNNGGTASSERLAENNTNGNSIAAAVESPRSPAAILPALMEINDGNDGSDPDLTTKEHDDDVASVAATIPWNSEYVPETTPHPLSLSFSRGARNPLSLSSHSRHFSQPYVSSPLAAPASSSVFSSQSSPLSPRPPSHAEEVDAIEMLKKTILTLSSFGPGFLIDRKLRKKRSEDPSTSSASAKNLYEDIFTKLALDDASQRLQQVIDMEPFYSPTYCPFLYGIAGGGSAVMFFGGSWWDMLAVFFMGTLVGMIRDLSDSTNFTRVYEFCAAVLVGFTARGLIVAGLPICYTATCLSSVILMVQGLTITLSMIEIATRNMISGTTRLAYGLVITAIIGYGLDLGSVIADLIFRSGAIRSQVSCTNNISPLWNFLIFPITFSAFDMSIKAHPKQIPAMLTIEAIAFSVSYSTYPIIGANLSAGMSALVVGVASNLYARWSGEPAIIYELSALLVLVPGCLAVRGFSSVLAADRDTGLSLATTVLLSAISIAIGLFMASLCTSPITESRALKRAKHGGLSNLKF